MGCAVRRRLWIRRDRELVPTVFGSLSHLILFDVFRQLASPNTLLKGERRSLRKGGRQVSLRVYLARGLVGIQPV